MKDTLAVVKVRLGYARAERLLKQQELADLAGIGVATLQRAEYGESITLLTAQKILYGLNLKSQELGLPSLKLSDLDWNVEGLQ